MPRLGSDCSGILRAETVDYMYLLEKLEKWENLTNNSFHIT
jgi:hypothetical protein